MRIQVLCVLLFCALNSAGQSSLFKNYREGLSSSEVYACMQDPKGYMWFATENGINRYDGYTFQSYSVADGLPDNTIVDFFMDSQGRIWYMPLLGMPGYIEDGILKRLDASFDGYSAKTITEDQQKNIYLGTVNGYLKVTYKSNKVYFVSLYTPFSNHPAFQKFHFYISGTDKLNNIWGYHNDKIVVIKNNKANSFHFLDTDFSIYQGTDFKITRNFFQVNDSGISYLRTNPYYNKIKTIYQIHSTDKINYVFEDSRKNLWVCTYNNGLFLYPSHGDMKKSYHYLNSICVSSVFEDKEGNYWITTIGNGVFFVSAEGYLSYTTSMGLSDNNILSMSGDKQNNIWMGLKNGLVNKLGKDSIVIYDFKKDFDFKYRITSILSHSDGSIWCGSDKSIFIWRKGLFSHFLLCGNFVRDAVKCLAEDANGNVWVGTNLTLFKTDGKSVVDYQKYLNIFPCRVTALYTDRDHSLWIGSEKGLYHFIKDSLAYSKWNKKDLFNRISKISSASNKLFISTKNRGFFIIDKNQMFAFSKNKGLLSDVCLSFVNEGDSVFWIATNKGLNKLKIISYLPFKYRIENFNLNHQESFNQINSLFKNRDTLWLATSTGLNFLNTKNTGTYKNAPPIYLNALKINDRDTNISSSFLLGPHQNNIKFSFVGISFKSNGQIKYKYKMDGIDANWNYTNFTVLQYPSLPPGQYTFHLSAINADGVESAHPLRFHFTIRPPFYFSWWFILLSILLFIIVFSIFFSWRLQLFKKKEEDRIRMDKLMNDMELKALRAQMNPHFVFNCMNSIQNFIIKNEAIEAHQYLSKFSRLMRNVLENSQSATISLEQEMNTLTLYMELENLRFDHAFTFQLEVDDQLDIQFMEIPSMLIQPYVENAIWHGVMHKNGPGHICISFVLESELFLKCSIQDNGIGRAKSAELKSNHENRHKSLGMIITHERLSMMNLNKPDQWSLQIIDLYDDFGMANGTRVDMRIPIS